MRGTKTRRSMAGVITASLVTGALLIAPGTALADTVSGSFPGGTGPFSAAMTADGSKIYFGSQTGLDSGDVTVFDVASKQKTVTIDTGSNRLIDLQLSPDESRLYTGHLAGQLKVIDTQTNTVTPQQITAGSSVYGIGVTPDGSRLYTSDHNAGLVRVYDASTLASLGTIAVGVHPRLMTITTDGSRAYVANAGVGASTGQGSVSVIDLATNTVISTITTGLGTWAVALSPDGSRLYASNSGSNTVSVIDVSTNTVTATVPVGIAPYQIAFTPDGTRAYVLDRGVTSDPANDTISVISTATEAVVSTIAVGSEPGGIAITPDGLTAYVGIQSAGTVWEIELDTFPGITTTAIPDGVEGAAYSTSVATTGRPIPALSVTNGALPPGLTLDANGTISGIPTTPGTYAFTVAASSSVSGIPSTATRDLAITVAPAPPAVLVAGDDDFTGTPVPAAGGVAGNVLANDTIDGAAVDPAAVTLTLTDTAGIQGATLDESGVLTLPAGVAAGTHTLAYELCEQADPDNCASATVLVSVLAAPGPAPTPTPTIPAAAGGTGQTPSDLASTGAPTMVPAAAFAVLLLGFGAALLVARRRARTTGR